MKILGEEWVLEYNSAQVDSNLKLNDGYCDKSLRKIVIDCNIASVSNLGNPQAYVNKVIRHEIVHAFLFESGLEECANWSDENAEQMVDWFACQGPKIVKCWKEAGCYE